MSFITTVGNTIGNTFGSVEDAAVSIYKEGKNDVSGGANFVVTEANYAGSGVLGLFNNAVNKQSDVANNLINNVGLGQRDLVDTTGSTISNVASTAGGTITDVAGTARGALNDTTSNLATPIEVGVIGAVILAGIYAYINRK